MLRRGAGRGTSFLETPRLCVPIATRLEAPNGNGELYPARRLPKRSIRFTSCGRVFKRRASSDRVIFCVSISLSSRIFADTLAGSGQFLRLRRGRHRPLILEVHVHRRQQCIGCLGTRFRDVAEPHHVLAVFSRFEPGRIPQHIALQCSWDTVRGKPRGPPHFGSSCFKIPRRVPSFISCRASTGWVACRSGRHSRVLRLPRRSRKTQLGRFCGVGRRSPILGEGRRSAVSLGTALYSRDRPT